MALNNDDQLALKEIPDDEQIRLPPTPPASSAAALVYAISVAIEKSGGSARGQSGVIWTRWSYLTELKKKKKITNEL